MNTIKTRKEILETACRDGLEYFQRHRTTKEAYSHCARPDWLFFGLNAAGVSRDDPRYRDAAREIALQVFEKYFNREDKAVAVVFKWLETGDESLREEARSAAESAAESTAWSTAWSAAESAAESTAWSTAWSAARSAAYTSMNRRLISMLRKDHTEVFGK